MDGLARDYLRLGLMVGRLEEGIVDAYYGPADIRAEVDEGASRATPRHLAEQAATLRERASSDPDAQRARWLDRQLLALETIARRIDGEEVPYVDEVERCFDAPPVRTDPELYRATHSRLDELLPTGPSLRERVDERGRRLTVPPDRLPAIIDWLVADIRRRCLAVFPAPAGEALTTSLVTGQPWAAYNWYDGGLHSRIEFNTDLPTRAPELISLVTHEAFPGHHLEHSWKETRLVREQGRAEATLQLVNTPEAYVSEGLAEVGGRYVVDREGWSALFVEICQRAGIAVAADEADRQWAVSDALRGLRSTGADAALMLHADGRPTSEVVAFFEDTGLRSREAAEKGLEFITHPLWRTYVFCYSGGQRLLGDWCAAAGPTAAQRQRFMRLLTEQLTPSAIAAELAAA